MLAHSFSNTPQRFSFSAMTTQCEISCYGLSSPAFKQLTQLVVARVNVLIKKYNFHSPDSWLSQAVNGRTSDRVLIDDECAQVLTTVRYHSQRAGGVFDITAGTLTHARKSSLSVSEAQRTQADLAAFIGADRWSLEDHHICFDNPHTRLDLGGVIKEYAVDISLALCKQAGASAALVNFGGDINCFGIKPDGERFIAAVQDPLNPSSMLFGLDLHNQALATSGHYARQRQLPDGTLSHIVSTDHNEPANPSKQWISATVVSHSTLISGIYSTSLLIKPDTSLDSEMFAFAIDTHKQIHQLPHE